MQGQEPVRRRFKAGASTVLIATSVGAEGLDFRQVGGARVDRYECVPHVYIDTGIYVYMTKCSMYIYVCIP